jgi:hypothetical protein
MALMRLRLDRISGYSTGERRCEVMDTSLFRRLFHPLVGGPRVSLNGLESHISAKLELFF